MATNWQIGDKIQNRWEIHKILRGGMGVVYIVYDHALREPFAAKTFQDEVFTRNPQIAERFTQEALTWINLDVHQNVTQARMVQQIEGKPFLFLQYVSGGDLGGWIGTPRLTEDLPQVLRFTIQFCDGMTHALSKGIKAHRDIKPQNCLITQDNLLKVTDFGLAKAFDDASSADWETGRPEERQKPGGLLGRLFGRRQASAEAEPKTPNTQRLSIRLSQSGTGAGTPPYMAPEQFDDFKHVDVRADIYAFGVMLFEMITGQWPFVGRTWREFEHLHKTQPPPRLKSQNSELEALIQTCLTKDPAQRLADFRVVREHLADIYQKLAGIAPPQPVTGPELDAATWNDKGTSLQHLGRYEEAIVCFDRAVALNPPLEVVAAFTFNKGNALRGLGRHQEAITCYDRALELSPRGEFWGQKGNALRDLGQHEEAMACYDRALELNPCLVRVWLLKGEALLQLGRKQDALTCFDRALELNPHEEVWFAKAEALVQLGRRDEAILCYNRALTINPRNVKAWVNKGAELRALGQTQGAIVCYERAVEIDPNYSDGWFNRANALHDLGRHQEALTCYDHVLKHNPRDVEAWINKGVLFRALKRYEDEIACMDHAITLEASAQRAWMSKGGALAKLGRVAEALACFEEANRLGNPLAAEAVAVFRQMLGQR